MRLRAALNQLVTVYLFQLCHRCCLRVVHRLHGFPFTRVWNTPLQTVENYPSIVDNNSTMLDISALYCSLERGRIRSSVFKLVDYSPMHPTYFKFNKYV